MDLNHIETYNLEQYINDIDSLGLQKTWDLICDYLLNNDQTSFLKVESFGELYEIGLAEQDKNNKKANGQYFTIYDFENAIELVETGKITQSTYNRLKLDENKLRDMRFNSKN